LHTDIIQAPHFLANNHSNFRVGELFNLELPSNSSWILSNRVLLLNSYWEFLWATVLD